MVVFGEKVEEAKLVRIGLNGFSQQWKDFVHAVVSKENIPTWTKLWDDFIQEELRLISIHISQQHGDDEENISLIGKRNMRPKKGTGGGSSSTGEYKEDMSKVKCFTCHKVGNYASQYPNKKKGRDETQTTTPTEIENFAKKFEKEFSLVSCL